MGQYVSQSGFAKLASVSRQAITRAVRDGRVESYILGIDPEHPTNQHYLNASRANAPRNSDRGLPQKPKSDPKSVRGKKVDFTALAEGMIGAGLDDYLSALSKPSTDRLKVVEQIKALRLKTDERRRTLVPRETVRRVSKQAHPTHARVIFPAEERRRNHHRRRSKNLREADRFVRFQTLRSPQQ